MMASIREKLSALSDVEYRKFSAGLIPNVDPDSILGVRLPLIRSLAKEIKNSPEAEYFLKELPHDTFEEMMLHGILIGEMKDYEKIIAELNRFLPYVNNWSVCDSTRIPAFEKHHDKLIDECRKWIVSDAAYVCRFGIVTLMCHYLDEDFKEEILQMVSEVNSDEYYINMAIAWFFATALAKQWDAAFPYIEQNRLSLWVHNRTIQKATESFRITDEQKKLLRTLKRKNR